MFEPIRRLARSMRRPTVAEREMAYINGSQDAIDLEFRQRQVDRGMFRRGF